MRLELSGGRREIGLLTGLPAARDERKHDKNAPLIMTLFCRVCNMKRKIFDLVVCKCNVQMSLGEVEVQQPEDPSFDGPCGNLSRASLSSFQKTWP